MSILLIGALGTAALVLLGIALIVMVVLRRVVPTNMVHIVQSSKATRSYGRGKSAGNTYYAFPAWVPKIGVSILELPESIFQVGLNGYEAYDAARLPFSVDVMAFFRVSEAETAAQRVASFEELVEQLDSVLKGAVRRILATNTLEKIMEARSELGQQFTDEVDHQIKEWGVCTVKTIEFMDLRDSKASNSKVIQNIMAKEQSRIDRESRERVAANEQAAQQAEIEAQRLVDIQKQDAEQQVGMRTAEKVKNVGISQEQAKQEIQQQAAVTAEKVMATKRVEQERAAEIEKQVHITQAEAERQATAIKSEGELQAQINEAKGLEAEGSAKAKAEELILLAPVTAQITLAKEIGANDAYQKYLLGNEQIKANQAIGTEMAKSIGRAEMKIIANTGGGTSTGGEVMTGGQKILDLLTPAGGTNLTGMLAALSQTDEGAALLNRITGTGAKPEAADEVFGATARRPNGAAGH